MRKNFDPEGRGLCVFLGGYVAISCCKLGEGAVGGQDVSIVLLSFSMRSAFAGMTFMLFLQRCCARLILTLVPPRLVIITWYYMFKL